MPFKMPITFVNGVESISKEDTFFAIQYSSGEKARLYILNNHVFKYYMSPTGEFLDYPEPDDPSHTARINTKKLSDYDTNAFEETTLEEDDDSYSIVTDKVKIDIDKGNTTMSVVDKRANKEVLRETIALSYGCCETTQTLRQTYSEHFFGGGMQNGRFTHKGQAIEIVNTNNWVDGGVTSPCPFYWSTSGYGILRNTWQPGLYDFTGENSLSTTHQEERFDAFFFINPLPVDILRDYYELTGQPILLPEYALYEAHLNAFNRDYWVEVPEGTLKAILFEDGLYYKSYKPDEIGDKKGILESLNGEAEGSYQFSARAMLDRYKRHDMPLGWFVPNDGYGSGYGQTDSLDGDISNLKKFGDYARKDGVEVALWTESNLHPADPEHPKKGERDLDKEVGVAGVVALKADVAWIGSGYSFGLNAIEDASNVFDRVTKHAVRPLAIMVDGWAGTQRCAGIWSGDQRGGEWEYIRFHIPTYVGTGLSGQPNFGSDMDGIYAGNDRKVNIRDYQWKTFTPLQLNMDGWGNIPKTPFSFDEEATKINRAYLKLKSMLLPYNYTLAHEAIHGLPMLRAMFLEFPDESPAYTKDSQYQFMWGPSFLVAPIYNEIEDSKENSRRDGIFLPDSEQIWVDLLTGEKYQGGRILYDVRVPLWKLPVFVKEGAIIPTTNANNNPSEIDRSMRVFNFYPNGKSSFNIYEDDGISTAYLKGTFATTTVSSVAPKTNETGDLHITIAETKGTYKTMVEERETRLQIMASNDVKKIKCAVNGENVALKKAETMDEYENNDDVYFFDEDFIINPYLGDVADVPRQKFLRIKMHKLNVTKSHIQIKISDFQNKSAIFGSISTIKQDIETPLGLQVLEDRNTPTSITLTWQPVKSVNLYEIERDGTLFINIKDTETTFEGFKYDSEHTFRVRAATDEGVSEWTDYVIGTTTVDPLSRTVKGLVVTCNLPCQPQQEVRKVTDGDCKSMWHTDWGNAGKFDPQKGECLLLNFDLKDVYEIDKVEYLPRSDGGNGNFLDLQYRTSIDGFEWTSWSDVLSWDQNPEAKTIHFDGLKFRYFGLSVLRSVGYFGSARQINFYKKV